MPKEFGRGAFQSNLEEDEIQCCSVTASFTLRAYRDGFRWQLSFPRVGSMLPELPPMALQGWWAALTQHTTNCTVKAEGTIDFPQWLVLRAAADWPNLQQPAKLQQTDI